MMRPLRAVMALLVPVVVLAQARTSAFPHASHARLFPTCVGCHAGISVGDAAHAYPAAAQCAACHDGKRMPMVEWSTPAPRGAGLLAFSHPTHTTSTGKDATCLTCHSAAGGTAKWMDVAPATPERCASCHGFGTGGHLADGNECVTCHRPLAAATGLTESRIATLPKPPSHARANFAVSHGATARGSIAACATCHARESCARCHADAGRSKTIAALAPDARVARFVAGKAPVYPTPADHRRAEFALEHGPIARASIARCAVCHSQPSCATCHTGDGARDVVDRLPTAAEAAGRGVQLQRMPAAFPTVSLVPSRSPAPSMATWQPKPHPDLVVRRVRVHPVDFSRWHGPVAATDAAGCAGCHAQRFCTDCHAGERATRRYHPPNFVSRHAPEAYGRDTECSTCHSTEAFCRDCHRQAGLGPKGGSRGSGFHNGQPQWLLQHGQAARQELTSCTSCHQQSYCLQCHSDVGWRVSPHGPGFDGARMAARNRQLCLRCHFKDPLAGK